MKDLNAEAERTAKLAATVQENLLQKETLERQAAQLLVANKGLQQAEERIEKVNHLYAFISQVNQKIVRLKDEAALFNNACNIALEFGKFKMAWIGIFDDASKKIILVEHCGIPKEEIGLFTSIAYQNKGLQDYVLRTGTYYICNDIANNLEVENLRPFAALHGIRSCVVLPIKKSGVIFGTLNLYSAELYFTGEEEIGLLVEVADDISFALDVFEKEKQHNKEVEEIKVSETLYHSLFDYMLEGFVHCKMIYKNGVAQDFIHLEVNEAFEKLTGLKNVVGKKATEVFPGIKEDNLKLLEIYGRVALTGKPERFEVYIESSKVWFDISAYSTEKGYFTSIFEVITEKKVAEEKLANSEKKFRALIEKSTDMKSLTTETGKVLYGSPAIKKGLGYTQEEFLLKYPYQLIHPDDIKDYLEKREQLLLQAPGESFNFQQRRLHKNGTWVWCEGTITNLLHESGVNALVTNFIDVSKRKKLDQQLEFNKNNLSALINNTTDLMWSVDRDFNLITANKPFDEMSLANFGKVLAPGSSVLSVAYTPEMQSHFKQLYERAFAGEAFIETNHFESPVEFWAEISYYPIRKGNEVIGSACHSRDITVSKIAERTSLRLASIVEYSRDAIISLSLEGAIVSWNRAAEILYEYSASEVIGKPYSSLLLSDSTDEFGKKIERLKLGEQLGHFELEHIQKSGTLICVILSISPINDVTGKLTGISTNAHNITEQKRAEEVLNQVTSREKIKFRKRVGLELILCLILSILFFYISDTYNLPEKVIYKIGDPETSILDDLILLMAFLSIIGIIFGIRRFLEMRKGGRVIQNALQTLAGELEMRVQERTNDLVRSNEVLLHEILERKKTEVNLSQSEARLKEAQTIAHISNWEIDLASRTHTWSDEFYKIFGMNVGEMTPSTEVMLSFMHPDDAVMAQKQMAGAFATLTASSSNFRFTRKDGTMRHGYIEWKFELDQKKPIRLYGILQDVTEQKEAEEKIKESEARLKEAQAIAHISNWEIDLVTGVNIWSNEFYKIFGIVPGTIEPSPEAFLSFLHPDDFNYAKGMVERSFKTREDSNFDCRTKPNNGRIKYLHTESKFEFDKNKNPIRLYGILQDITEQKETEKILKQNETRFREFFDSAPESIVIIDINTMTFPKFNSNAMKLLKYSAEELIKIGPVQVSPAFQPDGRPTEEKARELIAEAVNGAHPVFEWMLLDANGKEIISEVRLAAITDADGPQVIANFADITERKKTEKEIQALNEHLEKRVDERTNELLEANKALEAFSYSVSHDLRSPVRSVMGFAKLIKKEHGADMNAREKELFGHIEDSGKRMNAIIDDLLNFAKWGKEKLQLVEVDMTALFEHVWKNAMLESPNNAILELQPLPKIQADMAMIRQVVINLISNAVKYSSKKEKPVVKVGFERKEGEIIFHVSDNGAGFDMVHYSRLFGAFQRLHGMSEFEGTGIGLTLIKTIIEKHKGRVWAEGKLNEGATFYFALPVA